jgi:hypothetical protein
MSRYSDILKAARSGSRSRLASRQPLYLPFETRGIFCRRPLRVPSPGWVQWPEGKAFGRQARIGDRERRWYRRRACRSAGRIGSI